MTLPNTNPSAPPLSLARRAGPFLILSGQMARDASGEIVSGTIEVQTQQVLLNLKAILAANGASFTDVVKVTAWLTHRRHYAGFNRVYRNFISDPFPARTTVISQLIAPGAVVEIEVMAILT